MKTLGRKMATTIRKRRNELYELCRHLIQAKGENPPGDVSDVADVVLQFLKDRGTDCHTFEPVKGHKSVVATVGKGDPSLLFCGHIDVVPAGDIDKWSVDPYAGELRRGRLYGRGATDMKGGVAAMLTAIVAAKDSEDELEGSVTVALVPDEEAQGTAGVKWLLENKKLVGDMCIITEPTSYLGRRYSIVAGERGTCWLRIIAHGKPAHGSTPVLGRNAVEMVTGFLPALRLLESEPVETPKEAELLIKNGVKELRNTASRHGVSATSLGKTLTHYTVNVGVIAGGTKANVVPEMCEVEIDVRVPIGGHPDGVESFVDSLLSENMEYQVVNKTMPSYTPSNHVLVSTVQEGAEQVFGYRPAAMCMAATTDAHFFRELLGVPTVTFGPGYLDLAHSYDEFVLLYDVVKAAEVYANIIARAVV